MNSTVETLISLGLPLFLLVLAYFTGTSVERKHYRSIRARERESQRLPAITFRTLPARWEVTEAGFVSGSVVISVDYFKRFLAGLRQFVGGRVKSYESILDRARREAVLRLKAAAAEAGFAAVINVRLETTRMANGRNGQGIAGLEVLAYGTGVKLRNGVP